MAELTEKEIQRLNREIEKGGLTYTELQKELLDHLCCDVEAEMDEGLEFIKALEKVRRDMGKDRIQQIQEETLLLINQKYRMMKKFMYVLGMIAPSLLIIGTLFKIQHWPGAGVMIVLSLFMLGAIYLPVFIMVKIRDTRQKGKKPNMPMYIFGLIAGIVFVAGAMFKIQHWPGAGFMIMLSGIVTVAVFIPILVIQALKDKENQVQNFTMLIFVLSFVAITFMMYALRVSKNVLTSFAVTVNSHFQTNQVLENRNATYLAQFNLAAQESGPAAEQAWEISEKTDELDDYIQELMVEIVTSTNEVNLEAVDDQGNIDIKKVSYLDNTSSVILVMLGEEDKPGKGKELKERIDAYREFSASLAEPEHASMINKLLDTSFKGQYDTWEAFNFYQNPMMGALTSLSNMQTNLRVVEGELLNQLLLNESVVPASADTE